MLVKTDPPFLQEAPPKRGDSPLTLFHQLGGCPTGRRTAPLVGSRLKTFEVPDIPLPADGLGLGPEHTWSVTRRDTMCGRLFVQGRQGRFFWVDLFIYFFTHFTLEKPRHSSLSDMCEAVVLRSSLLAPDGDGTR